MYCVGLLIWLIKSFPLMQTGTKGTQSDSQQQQKSRRIPNHSFPPTDNNNNNNNNTDTLDGGFAGNGHYQEHGEKIIRYSLAQWMDGLCRCRVYNDHSTECTFYPSTDCTSHAHPNNWRSTFMVLLAPMAHVHESMGWSMAVVTGYGRMASLLNLHCHCHYRCHAHNIAQQPYSLKPSLTIPLSNGLSCIS